MVRSALLNETDGLRTYALVLDKGDEPVSEITGFAEHEGVTGAGLTGVGACRSATVGYFDPEIKDYRDSRFDEQLEVLSPVGDIATKDGKPAMHAHVVLGRATYLAIGGHLKRADVYPTMEVVLTETPAHLRKKVDPETGLALIALDESG